MLRMYRSRTQRNWSTVSLGLWAGLVLSRCSWAPLYLPMVLLPTCCALLTAPYHCSSLHWFLPPGSYNCSLPLLFLPLLPTTCFL